MKNLIYILIATLLLSCGSKKSIERETNKSKKIVVQKFIEEYSKEYNKLNTNLKENLINTNTKQDNTNAFNDFVTSEHNVKLAKEALKLSDILTEEQVAKLEQIINNASQNSSHN